MAPLQPPPPRWDISPRNAAPVAAQFGKGPAPPHRSLTPTAALQAGEPPFKCKRHRHLRVVAAKYHPLPPREFTAGRISGGSLWRWASPKSCTGSGGGWQAQRARRSRLLIQTL